MSNITDYLINESNCLHCGEGKPNYCEKCYQELVAENIKLRTQLDKLCTEMALLTTSTNIDILKGGE